MHSFSFTSISLLWAWAYNLPLEPSLELSLHGNSLISRISMVLPLRGKRKVFLKENVEREKERQEFIFLHVLCSERGETTLVEKLKLFGV